MKVLFLDDRNLYEAKDPYADLVDIKDNVNVKILSALELQQPGAGRLGGSWQQIMMDGDIKYELIKSGRKSDFNDDEFEQEYKLISGNY